jgi:parallel beta-helix repeat protein
MKPASLTLVSFLLAVTSLAVSPLAFADTYVSNCDSTVYSSYDGETIMITNDISKPGGGHCIDISNDLVTLDCQGYRITSDSGPTGHGVYVHSANYVTVQNCEFYNWDAGIIFADAGFGRALNNKLYGNQFGIFVLGFLAGGATIAGNKLDDNLIGIDLFEVANADVDDNTAHGNLFGIVVGNSGFNLIRGNQTNRNRLDGISIQNSVATDLLNNTSNQNGQDGIACLPGCDISSFFEDNTANRNDRYGINGGNGVFFPFFDNNVCRNNGLQDSTPDGLCK